MQYRRANRPLVLLAVVSLILVITILVSEKSGSGLRTDQPRITHIVPWLATAGGGALTDERGTVSSGGEETVERISFENKSTTENSEGSRVTVNLNIRCGEAGLFSAGNVTLDCRRRLPQVIGIGAKKCGTSTLLFFLQSHPAVVVSRTGEVHFWDRHRGRGLRWYRHKMMMSSQYQVTIEKSPAYFVAEGVPADIARELTRATKFLVILRDPVKRAVSDYAHVLDGYPHLLDPDGRGNITRRPVYPHRNVDYVIKPTFEESVLNENGDVNIDNAIIFTGIYVNHLREWLKEFPLDQFSILDGEEFVRDPLPQLLSIESFLGLPKYFQRNQFYFDENKRFYCLASPHRYCLGRSKGRRHPNVTNVLLQKLEEFYRPYNRQLVQLLGKTFSWT